MFLCASLLWNKRFLGSIFSPADCRYKTKGWWGRRHNSNWIMHQRLAGVESYFPQWRISLIRNQIQVKAESPSIQKSLSPCTYKYIWICLLFCMQWIHKYNSYKWKVSPVLPILTVQSNILKTQRVKCGGYIMVRKPVEIIFLWK